MKKIILVLGALIAGATLLHAQDIITMRNGEDVKATITEVTPSEVKYKKFGNQDGPVFTIRKNDILVIHYANGETSVFNQNTYAAPATGNVVPAGQSIPIPKYKSLKDSYNYRSYVERPGDPYSPLWSGVASFFIPGLGQMICGEVGRGLGFLGGEIALGAVTGVMSGLAAQAVLDDPYAGATAFSIISLVTSAAVLGLDIWAIVDAVRVAKVKDLYHQDMSGQYSFQMKMYPSVQYTGSSLAPGVTLAIAF